MKDVRCVTVVPVGPGPIEFVADTIESVLHYMTAPHKVVIVDDSHDGTGRRLAGMFPGMDLIETARRRGKRMGLYLSLSEAFTHALDRYRFEVLLRLDMDALVIKPGADADAAARFRERPSVGCLGSCRLNVNGTPRVSRWPGPQIERQSSLREIVRRPARWRGVLLMRRLARRARARGAVIGESCLGGACFYSRAAIERLAAARLLGRTELRDIELEEDHFFSLCLQAMGMELGEFACGDGPMGVAWRGLPMSPTDLAASPKKVIHSVRYWGQMQEAEVRAFFRDARSPPL